MSINAIVAIIVTLGGFVALFATLWLMRDPPARFPHLEPYVPVWDTEPLQDYRLITLRVNRQSR